MASYPALSFRAVSTSTGEVYEITVTRKADNLTCTCTCKAGQMGTPCKHKSAVLNQNSSELDQADPSDLANVANMLVGTDVEAALLEMNSFQNEKDEIDKKLKAAKQRLKRVLGD